ncbi:MAG: prefoldin subunit alpha [Methanobacteriota archaeon]|nr:MAG: prefoldin subunit alpha [Euryarchaeota archaeon]
MDMDDRETERLLAEYEGYKAQADALRESMALIEDSIARISVALEALEAASSMDQSNEILLPIGPDSFLKARIIDREHAFVGIGAGSVVKKPLSQAVADLEKRKSDLEERRKEMGESLQKVALAAQELAPRLRELVERSRKEG